MAAFKVFDEQVGLGTSTEVEVFGDHTRRDPSPSTPGVLSTNGLVLINVTNIGANNCSINVEWSPDKTNWMTGFTYHPSIVNNAGDSDGMDAQILVDRLGSSSAGATSTGVFLWDGSLAGSESCAFSFGIKGRFVRLNIVSKGTTIDVDAWIDAV